MAHCRRAQRVALHTVLFWSFALFLTGVLSTPPLSAEEETSPDISLIGGGLTSDLPGRFALQLPGPSVAEGLRRNSFLAGFPVFHRAFSRRDGLGPHFVNRSCSGCHVENGRGPIGFNKSPLRESTMVVRVSMRRNNSDGTQRVVPGVGFQLLDHDISGRTRHNLQLRWRTVRGRYPDGTRYVLRRPKLTFTVRRVNTRRIAHSLRMTPAVIGTGLLDSIPEETLQSWQDPEDRDGDGISGRINIVPDHRTNADASGRFGFKASQPTVEQQSLAALFFDMGVSNSLFGDRKRGSEFPEDQLLLPLVFYQRLAGVPAPSDQTAPGVAEGFSLFQQIGCTACHKINVSTGANADPELSNQIFHPFTDVLLHNMGRGLADNRREFSAAGREWRTSALWGLGFSKSLSKVRARFLHDGRARSIEEAILWHGGEALASATRFKELHRDQRAAVLAFLGSL